MYINSSDAGPAVAQLTVAWSQVATFVTTVEASVGKWLVRNYGIGLTEYCALAQLSSVAEKELRVNELASRIGLNQSSVTRLLGRLEAQGLTYRDTCPDDRRGVYAVIAEPGEVLLNAARPPYEARLADILQRLERNFPHFSAVEVKRVLLTIGDQIA
ncbi:MarR family winged helix-turn-helix transcriptional regulator [Leifsonia aquatica]|uniref:MarR family winged helix-turn-helix transcriptional regulator n=1 Tax=Leifsonia aquatica TaxID=144185 RepID=UPI00385007B0